MRRLSPALDRLTGPIARGLGATAIAAVVAMASSAVLAQDSGTASATGSDSLSLNGHAYELFGIDGFGFNQNCFVDGLPLACGVSAVRALQTLLDPAAVSCTPKAAPTSGPVPATCTGADGDIALKLVEQGWALADRAQSDDYVAAETAARDGKVGVWRGTFLEPAVYRAQVAAIETRYAALAAETSRAEVETDLAAGKLDLGGLADITVASVEAGDSSVSLKDHEIRFDGYNPGVIDAALEPPAVFDWTKVAGSLEATRREGIGAIETGVANGIWEELTARPSQSVDTRDENGFYAALKSSSASWIAAGRQPILFVMAPNLPNWIRSWFAGQAPAGAKISRRLDRSSPGYLGTIDGVDVYVGPGRERSALLVPSDILSGVTYRRDAAGLIVTQQIAARNEWVLQYAAALQWRADPLTWLAFPQMAAPTPDAD